jgi:hypothetical protein
MAMGGVFIRQPTAVAQVGIINSATDYLLARDPAGRNHLIRHSLPVAGGASGSPIVVADGEVVAVVSGGDFFSLGEGVRVSTGAGVNFAHRADLVAELLEGRAAEAQKARTAAWEKGIRRFASSREVFRAAHDQILRGLQAEWLRGSNLRATRVREVDGVLGPADAELRRWLPGENVSDLVVTERASGSPSPVGRHRLVVAICHTRDNVNLYVYRSTMRRVGNADTATNPRVSNPFTLLGQDEGSDFFPAVGLKPAQAQRLHIRVTGPAAGLAFTLYVFVAE